ncbi:hypothetical protein [Acinetobacter sp. YH12235]|uniref:hypothetical protein n=1 Tax=Acinetobacter sp. YH12235 TaxID=2601162 RepID=UPI0015D3741E|nr:hypothetical protein [Acinetobacter sp. YH12235]
MTLIQTFLDHIILNIDKRQAALIRNETKRIAHLGNIDFSELTKNQKNAVLKTTDKLFNNLRILHSDMEKISEKEGSFTEFFRIIRFPIKVEFSLFWNHIQLVDNLINDLNEYNFNKLKNFLTNLGSLKIKDQTLDDFWKEAISLNDSDIFSKTVFSLSLYSILSHLDLLTHRSLFKDIEPICLGWLFQKKLNPKKYQWKDGKVYNISNHKAIWTNPSRSLLTLIATFAAIKLDDEKPFTCHGLNLSDYLLNHTEKKEHFIKKANEGFPISYTDFLWLLSDKVDRNDIQTAASKEIAQETINILLNTEAEYESGDCLFSLWIIYRFFQNDCESRPKDTAFMHGIYYEFWEFFSNFYKNKSSNSLPNQWPTDLQKLAQPPNG